MASKELNIKGLENVCNVSAVEAISNAPLKAETLAFLKTLAEEETLVATTASAVDALRKKQAPIIYRIQGTALYKKGGFKNMSEYAATIGLSDKSKSLISGLYAVGKVLADKDAPQALKDMSASKIAQMGTLVRDTKGYETLKADAKRGALDDMTLAQVKDYTAATKDALSTTPKVVTTYTATVGGKVHDHGADTLEGWKAFWNADTTVEYIPLPKGKASPDANKATVNRAVIVSGDTARLIVYTSTTPDKPKDGAAKATKGKDEFLKRAMAEGMSDEAITMALRAMGWDK